MLDDLNGRGCYPRGVVNRRVPRSSAASSRDERDLVEALARVRTWKRGGQRAPHKPLLLLLALGRLQRGENRTLEYRDLEPDLRKLLDDYGPSRRSHHPEYPFWHLQSDGLWSVESPTPLEPRKGQAIPPVTMLRDEAVVGGFPEPLDALLRNRPDLVSRAAREILDAHFEPSLHADILAAVGLDLTLTESTTRSARDPDFPRLVLMAYEHRCAVCGLDASLDGRSIGLEAAHVKWHSHGGPSTVANGLCLCPLHHKALDLGTIGLTDHHRVLVSARVTGGATARALILDFHGKPLLAPQAGHARPDPRYVAWHQSEVFRGPARQAG